MKDELKGSNIFGEPKEFPQHEKLVEQALKTIELETGISRSDFACNTKKQACLEARKKAAKLLIEETQLSDEGIAKILGVSKSTANTYRNSLGFHRR